MCPFTVQGPEGWQPGSPTVSVWLASIVSRHVSVWVTSRLRRSRLSWMVGSRHFVAVSALHVLHHLQPVGGKLRRQVLIVAVADGQIDGRDANGQFRIADARPVHLDGDLATVEAVIGRLCDDALIDSGKRGGCEGSCRNYRALAADR